MEKVTRDLLRTIHKWNKISPHSRLVDNVRQSPK